MSQPLKVLLTGATGYVGGRLLPLLIANGHHVRCLARNPQNLASRVDRRIDRKLIERIWHSTIVNNSL